MKVSDVMTRDVESCRPQSNLAAAATIMWDRDCGSVPVVDDDGRVVGMITDRDICMALATGNRRASETRVEEVMAKEVRSCAVDADIRSALKVMQGEKLRRLPVVSDDRKLAGILTVSDILLHSDKGKSKKHVSHKDAMALLKSISEPRAIAEE